MSDRALLNNQKYVAENKKEFLEGQKKIFDLYIALVAVFFSLLGYVIIPITNSARDRGWDSIFKWLHNLSVFNTIVIMCIAIIQIFRATTL